MPYPFAHVAAAIPLRVMLGKRGVPSALVIGSIVPDLWYFVPLMQREDAHSLTGLLWFCLPTSLFLYLAFHLLFKQPLLDLMSVATAKRLSNWACPALPPVSWGAVVTSSAVGALVHLAWDAMTHPTFPFLQHQLLVAGGQPFYLHQTLQHASTLFGTAFVIWWCWRTLTHAHGRPRTVITSVAATRRAAILTAVVAPAAVAFCIVILMAWPSSGADLSTMRSLLRAAATTAVSVLGLAVVAYCVLWKLGSGTPNTQ